LYGQKGHLRKNQKKKQIKKKEFHYAQIGLDVRAILVPGNPLMKLKLCEFQLIELH
jgi:hypothetical protein